MVKQDKAQRPYVVASSYSRGEQWLGKVLAIRPIRDEVVPTRLGDHGATIAEVLEFDSDGWLEHGETPIFWAVIRGQLKQANADTPWVVGKLARAGQAYRLDEITTEEEHLVEKALATY